MSSRLDPCYHWLYRAVCAVLCVVGIHFTKSNSSNLSCQVILPSTHRQQVYLGQFYEVHSIHDVCLVYGNITTTAGPTSVAPSSSVPRSDSFRQQHSPKSQQSHTIASSHGSTSPPNTTAIDNLSQISAMLNNMNGNGAGGNDIF